MQFYSGAFSASWLANGDPDRGKTPYENENAECNGKNNVGTSSTADDKSGAAQFKRQANTQDTPEDDGSKESLDNTLLIDTLAREHDEAEKKKEKWLYLLASMLCMKM